MARTNRSRKAKTSINVDFTGVESSGNCAVGRQVGTVIEVEAKTSDTSGNDYLNWKFKGKGGNVYHTTSLQPQALWNLRSTLEALGLEVPDGPLDIDLAEFPDMELGMEVDHEIYQGKKKAVIVDLFPVEELDEEEGETEDGDDDGDGDEEGEGLTYADVMEMDKDELLEVAEEEEIKVLAKHKKKLDVLRAHIADALGLEEDEEGEGGLEDIAQAPLLAGMEKDELLELAEENDIKVLAKVKRNIKKLREFLIEELYGDEGDDDDDEEESSVDVKKGATVKFEDDGETLKGKVKSVNKAEGFAVVIVDGEEWEVELDDLA